MGSLLVEIAVVLCPAQAVEVVTNVDAFARLDDCVFLEASRADAPTSSHECSPLVVVILDPGRQALHLEPVVPEA
jgi:hypothetical protein